MNWRVCPCRAMWLFVVVALAMACDVSVKDGNISFDLVTGKAADDTTRTYTIAPDGMLEIDNRSGSIDVNPSDAPQLEIDITKQAEARSDEAARALLTQIEIVEERGPDRIRLETRMPRDSSTRVNYTVRAPRSVSTVLKTENGRVLVSGMAGSVRATGRNGPIDGKGLTGAVQASTINGPVRVDLGLVGGEINLATVNGPVHLAIPPTARANLSARTLNGRIVTSGLTFESLDQRSGREMEARLNGGGPRVRLETTNGPIFIATGSNPTDLAR